MNKQNKAKSPSRVTCANLSVIISELEELQHTHAALRGAATGLHHAIDNQEANGYEVEAMFTLIAKVLDQQSNDLIGRVTELMERTV